MKRKSHRKQYVEKRSSRSSQTRQNRKRTNKKFFIARIENGHLRRLCYILFVFVIVLALGFAAANALTLKIDGKFIPTYASEAADIAEKSKESDFILSNPSKIYDDSGKLLVSFKADTGGSYARYNEIPTDVVNAFIAIEDRTFWTNSGFDLRGSLRALVSVVKNGSMTQGGSTITQQLVRAIYLTREKSIGRKIKEIFLAKDITKKYSKKKIMEYYVNSCCYSNNIYGIKDAANIYFNKTPKQLTLSQAAYLCSIPNRPALYNPYRNSDKIIARRNRILSAMYQQKMISKSQYDEATTEKITIAKRKTTEISDYATTYAIHSATLYLMKKDGFKFQYKWANTKAFQAYKKSYNTEYAAMKSTLYTKGYTIKTTLNPTRQKKLQALLNEQMNRYSTRISNGSYKLQGAFTVIDNKTHKVVGIIGGRKGTSSTNYSLNRAFQSPRQPGSTIKPLVIYTPALEKDWTAYSTLRNVDVSTAYARYKSGYKVSTMGGSSMSLANAVFKSVNGCAIYLYAQVTPSVGLSKLTSMKFSTILPTDYGLASGLGGLTAGATTYEMANAYSTLANDGAYTQADCIKSIKDMNGNELYSSPSATQVYTKDAAQSMTGILRGVITKGTASSMNWSSSTDAAGKTGTTNSNKDAWFCGYTPYYTISVWCGNDDPEDTSLYGGTAPVQIWKAIQSYMIENKDTAHFENSPIPGGYSSSSSSSSYSRSSKSNTTTSNTTTENGTTSSTTDNNTDQNNQSSSTTSNNNSQSSSTSNNNSSSSTSNNQSNNSSTSGSSSSRSNTSSGSTNSNSSKSSTSSSSSSQGSSSSSSSSSASTGSSSSASSSSNQ